MRSFAEKARAAAWVVSLLSLLLIFVPRQVNAVTSFTECKFSSYQVFDVQWNISGENLNISGVTAPYDSGSVQPTIDEGDYFQFFESTTNPGTYGLKLFNSDGYLQQTMHDTGDFSAIGYDFLFYQGSGFFGTVVTTTQGLEYGESAILTISQQNPTNEDISSFASCSSTPIEQSGPAPTTTNPNSESDDEDETDQNFTPIPEAGFENNSLEGWSKGSQGTGTLGSSITNSGTGITVFSGPKTFTHGAHPAIGNQTMPNGSPNPYYAPAVESGSWTFSPKNGAHAVLLQPKSEQTFAQAMYELGLGGTSETAIRATLSSQAQASGFGSGNPTDAAWITREVQLTAGTKYTMSWNYIGTDYVPYNDGSITSLVPVFTESSPTITVNNSVGQYALLGFTNPGTGDYSTNSYGSTGWQISTYEVSVTGTYKLGFVAFNLDDTGLSPALMVDNEIGTTERCIPAGSNCTSFGGVVSNNPTAPTIPPSPSTTTPPTNEESEPAFYNAVQNLSAIANQNGSVFLNWDAPSAGNIQPYMYDISWVDLNDDVESGGWGVWTYAVNTEYSISSLQLSQTTGYGPVRFKVRAGSAACIGEGSGSCVYGPYTTVNSFANDPSASETTIPVPSGTTTPPPTPLEPLPSLPPQESSPQKEEDKPVAPKPSTPTTTPSETTTSLPAQEIVSPPTTILGESGSSSNSTVDTTIPQPNDISTITQDEAIALVVSAEVVQNLTGEQAKEIFSAIDQSSLTAEQAAAIVAIIQEAPMEIREAFESEINIYGGQFDNYVALGSTIDVGTRRAVIAVNLVAASVAVAATGLSSQGPSSGPRTPSSPSSDLAARKEDEEEEGGEIAGDGLEWIKAISIYKLVNGNKVINWSAFMRKFMYSFMNLGFTIAGAIVLFYTLSGMTRTIAMWSFGLAFAAAMYLAMKEPEEG